MVPPATCDELPATAIAIVAQPEKQGLARHKSCRALFYCASSPRRRPTFVEMGARRRAASWPAVDCRRGAHVGFPVSHSLNKWPTQLAFYLSPASPTRSTSFPRVCPPSSRRWAAAASASGKAFWMWASIYAASTIFATSASIAPSGWTKT